MLGREATKSSSSSQSWLFNNQERSRRHQKFGYYGVQYTFDQVPFWDLARSKHCKRGMAFDSSLTPCAQCRIKRLIQLQADGGKRKMASEPAKIEANPSLPPKVEKTDLLESKKMPEHFGVMPISCTTRFVLQPIVLPIFVPFNKAFSV